MGSGNRAADATPESSRPGPHTGGADDPGRLPPPAAAGHMSLEQAIGARRSVRRFADRPLTDEQISQLCWAGQGITDTAESLRAAPSAGALYPMEIYLVTAEGVDHYRPVGHQLTRHLTGDVRPVLRRAALDEEAIGQAAASVLIAAVVEQTARRYGRRAERYCFLEAGHIAQNILLQATALNLASVPIGAFDDKKVAAALKLPGEHRVLYIVAVGHPPGSVSDGRGGRGSEGQHERA